MKEVSKIQIPWNRDLNLFASYETDVCCHAYNNLTRNQTHYSSTVVAIRNTSFNFKILYALYDLWVIYTFIVRISSVLKTRKTFALKTNRMFVLPMFVTDYRLKFLWKPTLYSAGISQQTAFVSWYDFQKQQQRLLIQAECVCNGDGIFTVK